VRFLPVGPKALLVELDGIEEMRALDAEVHRRRAAGWAPSLLDVVPGGRTLLLDGVEDVAATARDLHSWSVAELAPEPTETIEIACVYDGPDLADVAAQWGVPVSRAIEIHSATLYSVAFCGFAPGFAYLAGLTKARTVRRRSTPRVTVPAGSVAVAGQYTGIYPRLSPGGWQIIGHTDVVLWDASRKPPALLMPGRRVLFREATEQRPQ
jgi:KipI family sensor histidine kinase inhibitor